MDYPTTTYRISVQRKFFDFFKRKNIQEQCTQESLTELKKEFWKAKNEMMNKTQLQSAFRNILQIFLDKEDFNIIFRKINMKNDGFVTWDEFISYLLLELKGKDVALHWQPLDPPILGVPLMKKTHHRSPVCKIVFCPEVLPDRTWSFKNGCYLTASKDGIINYWSLDLEYQRSVKSSNPLMKIQTTMITDMIVMPDIQIVCTSSIERDLRFYDTVANKFDLRVMITNFETAIVCMSYYFSKNIREDSFLILGNMNGGVKAISFRPKEKGPFKHVPERDILHLRYDAILAGGFKGLKVKEFKNIHSDWVSQVAYYRSLRAFISCSKCSECSLLVSHPSSRRVQYKFNIPKGITCFTFCEANQILVTGGPDCIVRVWNPFVPKKANIIFYGHRAAISALFAQNYGKRIYSLSKDKCIKVWDVTSHSCIQTYTTIPNELGDHSPMTAVYNDVTQKMIIASQLMAILVCEKVIDEDISDGYSHTKPISCVLYNHLFKVIVSTGLDSCITVWNPWYGHRLSFVTKAHSLWKYGEKISVEITAACFDISEQLLVTGARDGSVKMWQFNTGSCIRNLTVEPNSEVTGLVWLDNRILSVGWNSVITEFTENEIGTHKKSWEARHTEEITCLSMRYPHALATASYNGEIILWRLETGQPYRIYQANDPSGRRTIKFKKDPTVKLERSTKSLPRITKNRTIRSDKSLRQLEKSNQQSADMCMRPVGISDILFLITRPMAADVGTFMVALESGLIQVWTHHPGAGFLVSFSAIHKHEDFVTSLATDPQNKFLITGHELGYIKVWLMKNYMLPHPPKINMCALRLEFPFLWKDRIDGRAKRAVRDQPLPLLLSSLRGHMKSINSIKFVPGACIIISGSSDHTIKVWTLGGRYISTLGTFKPWTPILPNVPVDNYMTDYRIPPDVKKSASFTTMKVLLGGERFKKEKYKSDDDEVTKEIPDEERSALWGRQLEHPILGKYYELPSRSTYPSRDLIFDSSVEYISVYNYLKTDDLTPVEIPDAPSVSQLNLEKQDSTQSSGSPTVPECAICLPRFLERLQLMQFDEPKEATETEEEYQWFF